MINSTNSRNISSSIPQSSRPVFQSIPTPRPAPRPALLPTPKLAPRPALLPTPRPALLPTRTPTYTQTCTPSRDPADSTTHTPTGTKIGTTGKQKNIFRNLGKYCNYRWNRFINIGFSIGISFWTQKETTTSELSCKFTRWFEKPS